MSSGGSSVHSTRSAGSGSTVSNVEPSMSSGHPLLRTGALPSQGIRALSADGQFTLDGRAVPEAKIQPASYDLTIGQRVWCVKSSFLPAPGQSVEAALQRYALYSFSMKKPSVFTVGSTYVVELKEQFALGADISGLLNPKSSSGRINLWVRGMVDGVSRFDQLPAGYTGRAYAMVTPRSWPVRVHAGDSLSQLRLFRGLVQELQTRELELLHRSEGIIFDPNGNRIDDHEHIVRNGVLLTANLDNDVVAYQAKHSIELLDLAKIGAHQRDDFFTPITRSDSQELVLKEGEFYILPSYEHVKIPLDYAAEMIAYDIAAGEFRSHYAGFFDPGWGCDGDGKGTPIVLEILPHENVILRHRQPVCKTIYQLLTERSNRPYGAGIKSNYHGQRGPKLSKHFK